MRIIKGQANKVAATFTEKATESDSDWLLKFSNDTTGLSKIFAVYDISEYKDRANVFYITESDNEDLQEGRVSLSPSGQWTYTAYEMAPSSPRNLDPDDALGIVETGRVLVYDSTESSKIFFDEDDTKNNKVFDVE